MHQDRLAASNIQLVTETEAHYLFARGNCIALVEKRENTIGSTGMMTEQGLAYLVTRDGQAFLKSKSAETLAGEEQVSAIRQFSQDLADALSNVSG